MSDSIPSPHHRLRRLKAALLAVSLTLAGILLMMLNAWLAPLRLGDWQWLHALPLGELGGILFGAGVLSTFFEYTFRRDQEAHTLTRFRQIIREEAPTMRDAVVEGFAIHPEDLKRVATPELLDDIAANVMALRLGDEQFAREIYRDIRDQAIRAAERWYDVAVRVRLSTAVERSTAGTPLLDVSVEWEYTTVPSSATRRFACVSDQDECNELLADTPATAAWLLQNRPGVDAASRSSYELLELTVDGRSQTIRRSSRKTGQTYSVSLDEDAVQGQPVRIRQVIRTVVPRWGPPPLLRGCSTHPRPVGTSGLQRYDHRRPARQRHRSHRSSGSRHPYARRITRQGRHCRGKWLAHAALRLRLHLGPARRAAPDHSA